MRTKRQLSRILARRDASKEMIKSSLKDLISSLRVLLPADKEDLMEAIANNNQKRVGLIIHRTLLADAEQRSSTKVDAMLLDDNITLVDLDEII